MKKNHKKENLGNLMNLVKACTVKYLVLTLLLLGTAKLGAQVSMGADKAPQPFSVLELMAEYKSGTYGGLRLPQKGYYHCIKKYCIFATDVNNIKYFYNQLKINKICRKIYYNLSLLLLFSN